MMVQHMEHSAEEQQQSSLDRDAPLRSSVSENCISPRIIHIRATAQGLAQVFLPFSLLKHDPMLAVRQFLATQREHELTEDAPSLESDTHIATVEECWNGMFSELREDQRFFICAWNSVPGASPQVVRTAGLSFAIATAGPLYQRWLTTQPVTWKNERVVWSVAIEMRDVSLDEVTEIVLSEDNMLKLADIP